MSQLAQDLRAAKALIDTPEKWTKGAFARAPDGKRTHATSDSATSRCMAGACICASLIQVSMNHDRRANAMLLALEDVVGPCVTDHDPVTGFNDSPQRTHAEIMAAFDKAIAKAGGGA